MKNLHSLNKRLTRYSAIAAMLIVFFNQSLLAQYNCTDVYEPNNEKSLATPLQANQECHGMISSPLDVDWFQFFVNDQQPNLHVTLYNLPANYDISLYNSDNLKIGSSSNAETNSETIVANALPVGYYYLKIRGKAGKCDPNACYTLNAETASSLFREAASTNDLVNTDLQFELYPSLVSDKLIVVFDSGNTSSVTFSIYNLVGQKIFVTGEAAISDEKAVLDVSALRAGEYLLGVESEKGMEVRKFVVSK